MRYRSWCAPRNLLEKFTPAGGAPPFMISLKMEEMQFSIFGLSAKNCKKGSACKCG